MPSEERLAEAKRQIRERLRGVCSHLPDDDFEQLINKIALIELKSDKTHSEGFVWKFGPEIK